MESSTHEHTHGHTHGHAHGHSHGHNYAAANQEHFDKVAKEVDIRPDFQELARQAAAAVLSQHGSLLDPNNTTLMDYACGTGLVTLQLLSHVKSVVGVDISSGMLEQLNAHAAEKGIAPEKLRTVCVELKGEENELDDARFDIVLCSFAYHHFASISETTKLLAKFLKPGGSLLVIDFMKYEGPTDYVPEDFQHVVPHTKGFAESEIRETFEGAGLGDVSYTFALRAKIQGQPDADVFTAYGKKPLSKTVETWTSTV